MIQLHRLEGFHWVAKAGGYAKAARAFPYPITEPAIHQQVSKLQAELGRPLFERIGRDTLRPTPAGARLHEFVAPFFDGLSGVLREIGAGRFGGMLRVAAEGLMLRGLLPAWLRRLRRARPDVRVELRELPSPDATLLRNGEADLLVGYLPDLPPDVSTRRVATLRAFLVVPASHRLARRASVGPAAFASETFVSYTPGTIPHGLQTKALALHGIVPDRPLAAGDAETILGIVEAGLGYSLVPSLDPRGPRRRGVVARPLRSPKVDFAVVAAWRKGSSTNPLVAAALAAAPVGRPT